MYTLQTYVSRTRYASFDAVTALRKSLLPVERLRRHRRQFINRLPKLPSGLMPPIRAVLPIKAAPKSQQLSLLESPAQKKKRVRRELVDAGATIYGLLKSESRYLPKVLHDSERIEAIIYGQHNASSVMIVATDQRIVVLDKKPMAVRFDEVSYEVVSGIGLKIGFFFADVVLHTAITNFELRFVNMRCAEKFVKHIEAERLKRELAEAEEKTDKAPPEVPESDRHRQVDEKYVELMDNLSGYYLLPIEEEEREKVLHEIA